eukprot:TRINITY_DN7898_c0_g1_i7.p1 TRINITY_DN7898_c0_g1~~TRINITY_DN7898_c0_g1_i7.p1  ORF type:complete len:459 (+),score=35.51 TRINITY_DN7898_c0_g1_i7:188-1564(+)
MGCTYSATGGLKAKTHRNTRTSGRRSNAVSLPAEFSKETPLSTKTLRKWIVMLELSTHSTHPNIPTIPFKDYESEVNENVFVCSLLNAMQFSKRLIAGPPPAFRWAAWRAALNVPLLLVPGKYDTLKAGSSKWREMIVQDAKRTLPHHLLSHKALENVLTAYSSYNEAVGYCQGMNYVAGLLLLVSDMNEEEAFWAFVSLMEQNLLPDPLPLPGLNKSFIAGFPLVKLFEQLLTILMDEELKEHLNKLGLPNKLWLHKWLSSLFLYSFPIGHCVRFWDVLIGNGVSYFLPLACGILNRLSPKLHKAKSVEKCNEILKIPQHVIDEVLFDVEGIVREAKRLNVNWKALSCIVQEHSLCIATERFESLATKDVLQTCQLNTLHDNKQLLGLDDIKNCREEYESKGSSTDRTDHTKESSLPALSCTGAKVPSRSGSPFYISNLNTKIRRYSEGGVGVRVLE